MREKIQKIKNLQEKLKRAGFVDVIVLDRSILKENENKSFVYIETAEFEKVEQNIKVMELDITVSGDEEYLENFEVFFQSPLMEIENTKITKISSLITAEFKIKIKEF